MLATLNLNYSILGFRSGLNVRYSTENSQLRQSMNRISFNAGWRWISVSAGDVNPTFNKFSLRGTNVRGAELQIDTRRFGAHFVAGQVNKRITGSEMLRTRQQSYERWLYGGRLRFGTETGGFFGLGVVYAIDINEPLFDNDNSASTGGPARLSPKENLTLSPDFKITLFNRKFELKSENTISLFTRDLNSETLDLDEAGIPDFVSKIYKPRTSTRVNFATNISTRINISPLILSVGYERIQPGYNSLGLRNIRDDDQNFTIQPQVSLASGRVNLSSNVRLGRDNLLNQRVSTQYRRDVGLNVQAQITQNFSLGAGYNILLNQVKTTGSADDDASLNYPEQLVTSQSINIQPVYSWAGTSANHALALSGNVQILSIDIENVDSDMNSTFFTNTLTYSLTFFGGLNFNSGLNFASGTTATSDFNVLGANVGIGHSLFDRKLSLNLTGGLSRNSSESVFGDITTRQAQQQINGNFTAMYRPRRNNTIRLNARTINNSIIEGTGMQFQEFEVRLTIDQRF